MFKNFLVSAIRNLLRHRMYSTINIGGLALGLAASLLILLFVRNELGYDKWIPDSGQIYRLHTTVYIPGRDVLRSVASSGRMGPAFKQTFPEIEATSRLTYTNPRVFHENEVFQESIQLVDRSFFDVFDLPLIAGDRDQALQDFTSMVVSESVAKKYFGNEPAIGQTLTVCCYGGAEQPNEYRITGIIADAPVNSHFFLNAVILIDENQFAAQPPMFESWTSMNTFTYVKMADGKTAADISDRFEWFLDNVMPPMDHGGGHKAPPASEFIDLSLMPIEDIYLHAREQAADMGDIRPLGNFALVVSFMLIALLILGIATINFLNLTTARFISRAREVSMRKVLGANRREVAMQFLGETVITSLFALLLSLLLVALVLPWFNALLGTELLFALFSQSGNWLILAGLALVTGVLGGLYPSFVVSRMRPAQVFNSATGDQQGTPGFLKNTLIVFQFSISIALITVTLVTWSQTDYIRSADLGYESNDRIVLSGLDRAGVSDLKESLYARLRQMPEIRALAYSSEVPTESRENNTEFTVQGREQAAGLQILNYISADYSFFTLFGIEPLAGRDFAEEFVSDPIFVDEESGAIFGSMILNESAAQRLGFDTPEQALGAVVTTRTFGSLASFTVVGVIPDINNRSARFESIPTIYWMRPSAFSRLTIYHDAGDEQALLGNIEAAWKELVPMAPFSYSILDDLVQRLYLDEERQVLTFSIFALLAIFISGLGLYAMASFTVIRRTREIGLRKVMGARVLEIIRLLLWQLSKPVVIANLLAWPVAWYFLNDWLTGFYYRIGLNPLFFIFAGITALLIAWITVAGHAWRVAIANPVHALRYE